MDGLKQYDKNFRREKASAFVKEHSHLERDDIRKIYFLKSLNEKEDKSVLPKLKKILDDGANYRLALSFGQSPYNFDKLDKDGIVEAVEQYYEVYLIIDKEGNYYYIVIQENNFFKDKPQNELVYFKKTSRFLHRLYFPFGSKIK